MSYHWKWASCRMWQTSSNNLGNTCLGRQGHNVESKIKCDNKSFILLEEKGTASSHKWTKHSSTRSLHVKDTLVNPDLKLNFEYFPSDDVIRDYFTKPLQGHAF